MIRCLTLLGLISLSTFAKAQSIPVALRGEWKIVKILSTKNQQCWDADRAKSLIGTTLRYSAGEMVWNNNAVPIPEALSRSITRKAFPSEYRVDLSELGIAAPEVTEIDLQHDDADLTGATTEVPGDTVVLAGPGRIVVSACGVFYSAVRASAVAAGPR